MFVFVFVFAVAIGAMWEIYEYTFDGILNLNMQQAREFVGRKALLDTILDLCCNVVGGVIAGTICAFCTFKNEHFVNYFKFSKINKEENSITEIIEE